MRRSEKKEEIITCLRISKFGSEYNYFNIIFEVKEASEGQLVVK